MAFTVEVPGQYHLVDHALSRAERGPADYLNVEGDENPDVFGDSDDAEEAGQWVIANRPERPQAAAHAEEA